MIADGHRHTPAGHWNARWASGPHIQTFRHPRARFRHTRHPACATIVAEPFFAFSSKTRNGSAGRPSRATPRPASPEKHTSLVSDFAGCSQNMVYAHFGVTSHVGALGCLLLSPHPDSKCTPAKPVQSAAVAQSGQRTTKDLTQEQLSNLFTDLVSGTKVLPVGVVNAVPGAIPDAYAPTRQAAEANLCHPKRCGQPKTRKVSKGTQSAIR